VAEAEGSPAQIHSRRRNNEIDIGGNVHYREPDILRELLFKKTVLGLWYYFTTGLGLCVWSGWQASYRQSPFHA
jgi:hypothetical protein